MVPRIHWEVVLLVLLALLLLWVLVQQARA